MAKAQGTTAKTQKPTNDLQKLQMEVSQLFPVSEAASRQYREKTSVLADKVDESLLNRSDIAELIGQCPVGVITANHRNHARFMQTVFILNLPYLLVRVLPWVYCVYGARGVRPQYFYEELKAWASASREGLAPQNADEICGIYEWMIDRHEDIQRLAEQLPHIPENVPWNEDMEALLSCLMRCDSQEVGRQIKRDGAELPLLYVNRIQPVMYRVGTMWADGEINVAQEHLVTAMVNRIMTASYESFPIKEPSRGKVVIACCTDEFHELGARMVGDILELDGWDVTFLGANVPERDFHELVKDTKPEIVGLSATMPYHLLEVKKIVDALKDDPSLEKTKIMAGGLPFSLSPEAKRRLRIDAMANDGLIARQITARWWEEGCWS